MTPHTPFKQLILRAVLHKVSPMVILVISVPDSLDLAEFDEGFCCSPFTELGVAMLSSVLNSPRAVQIS